MFKNRTDFVLYSIILLTIVLYVLGLQLDVTRDAAKYAYIAKTISQNGNFFDIKILGEAYHQKPPLLFWLSALSFKTFGVSNFTFKLPILLYSLFGFFATYKLGELLYDKKTGFLSLLLIMVNQFIFLYTMDIHTDILLMSNVVISLWMIVKFLKTNEIKYAILIGIFTGLSVLAKGPMGLSVPALAILGYAISKKQLSIIFNPKWLITVLLFFIVVSPYLFNFYKDNGLEGIWFFIWENNIGRITGSYMGTQTDYSFYFHTLLYMFLPWSVLLVYAAFYSFRNFFKNNSSDHFIFWSTWIIFIVLSISKSKLPNYIMIILPLLAISAARWWALSFTNKSKRNIKLIQKTQNIIIWGLPVFAIFTLFIFPAPKNYLLYIAIIFVLLFSFYSTKKLNSEKRYLYRTCLSFIAVQILLTTHIIPLLFDQQAQPKVAEYINTNKSTISNIYNFELNKNERNSRLQNDMFTKKDLTFGKTPQESHFFLNYELMFYANCEIKNIKGIEIDSSMFNLATFSIYTDKKGKDEITKQFKNKISNVKKYKHFDLRRTAKFLNPTRRDEAFETMYFITVNQDLN